MIEGNGVGALGQLVDELLALGGIARRGDCKRCSPCACSEGSASRLRVFTVLTNEAISADVCAPCMRAICSRVWGVLMLSRLRKVVDPPASPSAGL